MASTLEFTDQAWEAHEKNWLAWWAGELSRPLAIIESPVRSRSAEELTMEFLLHKPVDEVLDYYHARLANQSLYGDAWPKWFPFFGAGVVAAFLGSKVHCAPDAGTVWFEPGSDFQDDHTRNLGMDPTNKWWHRIQHLTRAAVERWGDRVCIGCTDLGGNLDILASLRTNQDLLMDLIDQPNLVTTASEQVTGFWLHYYNQLHGIIKHTGRGSTPWAAIWAPERCYMLQSDFSAMISPQMFERFVLPDLTACIESLDYAFYHLDGKGQIPHLDHLLALPGLRGIQWIPGDGQPPPDEWLPLLKRIRDAGKLCQLYVSTAGALTITRHLSGKGFAFYITDSLTAQEAEDFLQKLYSS